MHTEHLKNVGLVRVVVGWLIAVAVTSLMLLAMLGFGMVSPDASTAGAGGLIAVLVGFAAGGFAIGFRALRAPILHGIAIGLTSLLAASAFAAINAFIAPATQWTELRAGAVVLVVMSQFVAAIVGALIGYNVAVRGRPGLGEPDLPEETAPSATPRG
jgi:hypothetical protein